MLIAAAVVSAVLLLSGFGAPPRDVRPARTVSSLPLLYHFALISARAGRILKTGKARFLTAVADGRGGWYLVGGSGLSHRRANWTGDPGWGSPEAREVRSCSGVLTRAGRRLYLDGIVRKPGSGRICTIQAFDADTGKRLWVSAAIRPFKPSYAWNALAATPARVYVGGHFHWIGGRTTGILAALDPHTGKLLGWKAPSFGVDPAFHGRRSILALTVSGSRLYVGGVFRSIAGKSRHSIGALDSTSGSLLGWKTPVKNNPAAEISEAGGYVVFAGENGISIVSARTGEPLNNLLTATLAMSNVGKFAVSGSLVYLGGYIDIQLPGNSGPSPHLLTAIDLATGRFTNWGPEVTANHQQVGPIVPSGREVLVLGEFGRAS